MDLGRYLVERHLREGTPVAELAATHGVHRSWLYKLLARYRADGYTGLEARSRRPHRSPTRISDRFEDEIVALRKRLDTAGFDAGAQTIHTHLARTHTTPPSVSTIWRVLHARGFVTPQPHKRPRSSYIRFVAELPNECWQMDVTHVALKNGSSVDVLNVIDDHSRLCLASRAFPVTTAADVVVVFYEIAQQYGFPATVLSDNGAIFTASFRGDRGALATELAQRGIVFKHSRPYHPQTCGKVERFHQTMKKYLAANPTTRTLAQLQTQLDVFATYYNDVRPHRSKHRTTPRAAYTARVKAKPAGTPIRDAGEFRIRRDCVDQTGKVTLRYAGKLRHLAIGRAHRGQHVLMLINDRDVRVLTTDGEPIAEHHIDPGRIYQPRH